MSLLVRSLALRWNILDEPGGRKSHRGPTPLLGGLALFFAFHISVFLFLYSQLFFPNFFSGYFSPKYIFGIFIGGLILMIGGYFDDRYHLSPKKQIIFPILAALVIIASGAGVLYLFQGRIPLDQWSMTLFTFHDLPYKIVFLGDVFVFFWLLGMMYTTKIFDGLDGLVSGVGVIASFIMAFLSFQVNQPETGYFLLIFGFVCLGFLPLNYSPAKLFLGEGGALYIGFMLGVFSILSGAKVATAFLLLGIPILDIIFVICWRVFKEKKSPFLGDRNHLHFRLLDLGMTQRQAVALLWLLILIFGSLGLFSQGYLKIFIGVFLALCMLVFSSAVLYLTRKKK